MEDFKLDKFVKSNEGLNNDFYSFDIDKLGYREAFLQNLVESVSVKFILKKKIFSSNIEELACFYKYLIIDGELSIPTSSLLEIVFMP